MRQRTPVIPRCTVQRHNGEFCDAKSDDWLPFPICGPHASKLFMAMSERLVEFDSDPWRKVYRAVQSLDDERERKARVERPKSYVVYYVLIGDLLKIGYSGDLHARMRTYPPHRKLLATEPGGPDIEGRRHAQFKHLLASGREWFRFEGDLVDHVQALRAAA